MLTIYANMIILFLEMEERGGRKICPLNELKPGETGIIEEIEGEEELRLRLLELGFTRGNRVTVLFESPFSDPVSYQVGKSIVGLRRSEASHIIVRVV